MRTPVNCPFVPGSDHVPEIWAGREEELADAAQVVLARRIAGVYERGRAYLGEFGIGKSVLVNRLAADAEAAGHWVAPALRIPTTGDPLAALADVVNNVVSQHDLGHRIERSVSGLLSRVEQIALPVVGGTVRTRTSASEPNPHRAVSALIVEAGRLARSTRSPSLTDGRALILRLDEVQNASGGSLSQLLIALGDALDATDSEIDAAGLPRRRVLPVVVLLSGLPGFGRVAAEAGATFARRFRTVELDPLEEPDLQAALRPFTAQGWTVLGDDGPVAIHFAPGAVGTVVHRCLGDPFLFQLAGQAAWNAGTGPVVTAEEAERGWLAARREIVRYVDGRVEGLSPLQADYLRAAALLDPAERSAGRIAVALDRASSTELGSTAYRLERRGLIRRRGGTVAFRSATVEAYLRGDWP